MTVEFRYPILVTKVCPKEFNCSHCGSTVCQGHPYVRTNHGKYCMGCRDTARDENKHTEKVG